MKEIKKNQKKACNYSIKCYNYTCQENKAPTRGGSNMNNNTVYVMAIESNSRPVHIELFNSLTMLLNSLSRELDKANIIIDKEVLKAHVENREKECEFGYLLNLRQLDKNIDFEEAEKWTIRKMVAM